MLLSDGVVAPVSLADSQPLNGLATYYSQNTLALTDTWATYAQLYRAQPWIATLVNKIAYGTARLPLKVYQRDDIGRDTARDTPYARLLRNPNTQHDPFFFWLWTSSTFEVYGEAMWVKIRTTETAAPHAVYPLHPANIITRRYQPDASGPFWSSTPNPGEMEHVYYGTAGGTALMRFAERDVVHFKSYNPENQIRGVSRLEPLRVSINTEDAIRRAQTAWYKHGARPSAYLTHPKTLTDGAATRLKSAWDSVHSSVDNWGKTAILEEGMTANILQLDAVQMDLIASLKLSREEYCAIFDVPPPAVHILDHATFSNITENLRSVYRDTMAPRLALFESVLDTQLRPDFDRTGNFYAEFLMDEVLRGSFEQRAGAYETMTRIGAITPGEVRERENLPDLGPDTHRLYVNAAIIPLGTAAGANATGHEVVVRPQVTKAISPHTARVVAGRAARAVTVASLQPETLIAGLNGDAVPVLEALHRAVTEGESVPEFRDRIQALTVPQPAPPVSAVESIGTDVAKRITDQFAELRAELVARERRPEPPVVNVTVDSPDVLVTVDPPPPRTRTVERDVNGDLVRVVEE